MTHAIVTLLEQYGYPMLFAFMLTGIVALPWPLEFLLFFSSGLSSAIHMSFVPFLLTAWLGTMGGMVVNYEVGRRLGLSRIALVTKYMHIKEPRLRKFADRFQRAALWVVLIGFFVTGLRHLAPLLAGASGMRLFRFLGLACLGSLIWVSTFAFVGKFFSHSWDKLEAVLHHPLWMIFGIAAAGVIIVFYLTKKKRMTPTP